VSDFGCPTCAGVYQSAVKPEHWKRCQNCKERHRERIHSRTRLSEREVGFLCVCECGAFWTIAVSVEPAIADALMERP
jgi:hypothetical protein